uniref:Reverse transcriptase domain-containing protein n=1 Tax=Graphocephala atropunctata TaxID=36148 RepID=A0A1B6MC12_9HEMI
MQTLYYGVPQGSILGPLLFICYVTGLPLVIPNDGNKICLYADDTNLIVSGSSIEQSSNNALNCIKNFFNRRNLLLNPTKTNLISFKTKQSKSKTELNICIDEHKLNLSRHSKFLGLIIDEHLSWDLHVDSVLGKMTSGLYAMRKMSKSCSLKTLKQIYFALIHSHISYGISIYGSTKKNNLEKILKLQKKAIRIMLNLKWKDSVKTFFAEFDILTVYNLYIFETIILTVRLGLQNVASHNYNTRHRLKIEKHNLEFFKKKTSYMGSKLLKYIPVEIRNLTDHKKFKKALKAYLISHPVYSIDEFFCPDSAG